MITLAKSFLKKAATSYLNRKFRSNSLQMLFLIGHMRSGSSLLVHILNTNSQIIGYGETHRLYRTESDFIHTSLNIYRSFKRIPFNETYILDKILHSYLIKNRNVLTKTKIIFLLRNPLQTMPSIHKLNPQEYTPSATFNYYKERLERIKALACELSPAQWTFTTYDELINRQDLTFRRIERLLDLNKKLSPEYDTMWSTGKKGIGDSSGKIHSGKIMPNKKKIEPSTTFDPFIDEANAQYMAAAETLQELNIY